MTIREWCSSTNNVFYGATQILVYRKGCNPVSMVVGVLPEHIARREVEWVRVNKINPDTMTFLEVEVMTK